MEVEATPPTHTTFDLNHKQPPYSLYSDQPLFSTLNAGIPAPECESPTSHSDAAMKLQKHYRGYRTRRLLADSAVVAEELWWQAIDFARLNHSTISFFNFLKPESAASRWNRISLNASKVGKGLSLDCKAHKLAFQHWIEAIDPRHRYGHSLHIYYEEWCKADAGQPFFYWLDVGDGKEVDLKECPRSKLRQQCIKYLGPQERENYEYIIIEGKIIHTQTQLLLDTTNGEKWIFVTSTSNRLYVGEKKKGRFHHSSFLAGGAAGMENGTLKIRKANEDSDDKKAIQEGSKPEIPDPVQAHDDEEVVDKTVKKNLSYKREVFRADVPKNWKESIQKRLRVPWKPAVTQMVNRCGA